MVIEIKVPDIGLEEVEVTEVLVKVGDKVEVEQSLITVEGDKASIEIPAPYAGTVKELKVTTTDKVSSDSLILILEVEEENIVPAISAPGIEQKVISSSIQDDMSNDLSNNSIASNSYVHAAPTVRRLAYEFGIDLKIIKGTGLKSRILKEDIQSYIKDLVQSTKEVSVISSNDSKISNTQWPKVDFNKFGEIKEIELSRIKKISGANLSRNWMTIPHVTLFEKSDITELESFRKQQNTEAEKKNSNVKYSLLVFIMKALAAALEQMPIFNSSLSENGQKLIIKKYINIGIAVDTATGLVVPVIKEINKKGIIELSRQLVRITKKAHDNKLTPSDMQGGSFTISSLGGLGTTSFTPIINAPEVAILGISKAVIEPVWNGKKFTPRLMMPMSLSFDHRIIDGADGIRFINVINNFLRDIRLLLM